MPIVISVLVAQCFAFWAVKYFTIEKLNRTADLDRKLCISLTVLAVPILIIIVVTTVAIINHNAEVEA